MKKREFFIQMIVQRHLYLSLIGLGYRGILINMVVH